MSNESKSVPSGLYLAIDSGSPIVSVAVGMPGETLAVRSVGIRGSSEALLALIHEALEEAGAKLGELEGMVALAGPGSFTGLRVGFATLLGLHLSTAIPSTTFRTLDILALQASKLIDIGPLVAAVDAQRGEWAFASYEPGSPPTSLDASVTMPAEAIGSLEATLIIGFGCSSLPATLVERRIEPTPLAPTALDYLALRTPKWDSNALREPIYSRPPAIHRSQ